MGFDDGAVDHHDLEVALSDKRGEHPGEYAPGSPAVEPLMRGDPLAELLRQVSPGCSGSGYPPDPFDHGAVAGDVRAPARSGAEWEMFPTTGPWLDCEYELHRCTADGGVESALGGL